MDPGAYIMSINTAISKASIYQSKYTRPKSAINKETGKGRSTELPKSRMPRIIRFAIESLYREFLFWKEPYF